MRKYTRAEKVEAVKKDDKKVASVREDKSLLDRLRNTVKGK